jgi:hypothetical protein
MESARTLIVAIAIAQAIPNTSTRRERLAEKWMAQAGNFITVIRFAFSFTRWKDPAESYCTP